MHLHSLKWEANSTVEEIINLYLNYVAKHYGMAVHNVFDGYLFSSTKDHCHQRRRPITGLCVDLDKQTRIMTSKDVFLSNSFNKQIF